MHLYSDQMFFLPHQTLTRVNSIAFSTNINYMAVCVCLEREVGDKWKRPLQPQFRYESRQNRLSISDWTLKSCILWTKLMCEGHNSMRVTTTFECAWTCIAYEHSGDRLYGQRKVFCGGISYLSKWEIANGAFNPSKLLRRSILKRTKATQLQTDHL